MGDIGRTKRKYTLIPEDEPGKRHEEIPEAAPDAEPVPVPEREKEEVPA